MAKSFLHAARGLGQQSVAGGEHTAALAEQLSNHLRSLKAHDPDAVVHIFAACPNSFLFFLGQHHQSIAPCIVYEFDFDRRGSKTGAQISVMPPLTRTGLYRAVTDERETVRCVRLCG